MNAVVHSLHLQEYLLPMHDSPTVEQELLMDPQPAVLLATRVLFQR
jgi:hypothetical protein